MRRAPTGHSARTGSASSGAGGAIGEGVPQHLQEALGQGPDLLLLDLEGDELVVLAGLEVEGAVARLADRADGEVLDGGKLETVAHRAVFVVLVVGGLITSRRSPRPPVELTARTTGPVGE